MTSAGFRQCTGKIQGASAAAIGTAMSYASHAGDDHIEDAHAVGLQVDFNLQGAIINGFRVINVT